jgi:branched-chain amino acid transport system ATP-binding protein
MKPLLQCNEVSKSFGGLKAIQGVNLRVSSGQIVSIIGPNGAGKTTFFNCLSGVYVPDGGRIELEGRSLKRLPTHRINRLGIARTFQNIRLFSEMSALENVQVAQFAHEDKNPFNLVFCNPAHLRRDMAMRDEARELLEFVGLGSQAETWARNLSYGLQRRLEIARALATRPKLLLLDEPAAGMNPREVAEMIKLIRRIKDRGLGVVLIEHHMKLVMEISDYIYVLDHGILIAEGAPSEVSCNPRVIAAYLGTETEG